MKNLLHAGTLSVLCLILLACIVMGAAPAAYAVPPGQVLRSNTPQTFTGICCFSWFETVRVNEPAVPVPVIVRWSTDYNAGGAEVVGLSVNGGACLSYGARSLYVTQLREDPHVQTKTFEWVVFPQDGGNPLHKGVNTFTLCGGGQFFADQSITIMNNTLSARTSD